MWVASTISARVASAWLVPTLQSGRRLQSAQQRRDHALQEHYVRACLGPQPMTAGQLDLDGAGAGRLVPDGRLRSRQRKRNEARAGRHRRRRCSCPASAPPAEQQARMKPVPARHLGGRRRRILRLGEDRALLLGRPGPSRSCADDVRRVRHRSRHRADTAPSRAITCIQTQALSAQGSRHRALTPHSNSSV